MLEGDVKRCGATRYKIWVGDVKRCAKETLKGVGDVKRCGKETLKDVGA